MILYRILPSAPEAHLFQIQMHIAEPASDGQVLTLPAWIPGSYMIRDFARNIVTLEARCGESMLMVEKLDKQTWRCAPCPSGLVVSYQVYAWDFSVRGAHLDTTHGYFNGTSVFLRAIEHDNETCQVEIQPPRGRQYRCWRLATTMPSAGAGYLEFGLYQAADYQELIDHPVEMGEFDHIVFKVAGVDHEIAITGRQRADLVRLSNDLKAICENHIRLFGELPQMERYLFQITAVGDGYGGLEHRSSTSLICKRSDLPVAGETKTSAGYRQLLGLCSHEYFHLWNVKRIKPLVLQQADLSHEVHTRLLWVFEGITSYYDDLALIRSGRIDILDYLQLLSETVTRVTRGSGRLKQTLSDSSFDAWTKFYKQDENAPNAIVSYYTKGALTALLLDLTIRQQTRGEKSLDDLMLFLWEQYGRRGTGIGETEIETLAKQVTGLDLDGFFDATLRSTAELELGPVLAFVGVGYRLRPAWGAMDLGGIAKGDAAGSVPALVLGARHRLDKGEVRLTQVLDNGAAQRAGLSAGDILVAINGIRVSADEQTDWLKGVVLGDSVYIHAFRRDELMTFELHPQPPAADTCELWLLDEADQAQLAARKAWLQQSG